MEGGTLTSFTFFCLVLEISGWSFNKVLLSGRKANLKFAESIAWGAQRGMEECRSQFAWERWNCPSNSFAVFSKTNDQPATREMAFVHSILSAGIMHTVTRNCSLGHFDSCGCDFRKKGRIGIEDWTWGGCSDNVHFGSKMAKDFMDNREKGQDDKAQVNLHNYRVGLQVVKKTMKRMCKCIGVSGSCATKMCWMRLAEFKVIGEKLKAAYTTAVRLDSNALAWRYARSKKHSPFKASRSRLLFIEDSPVYCMANATAGSLGTLGRQCSRRRGKEISVLERTSCRTLCRECGLRVKRRLVEEVFSCKCKFHWCCQVKCEQCRTREMKYTCR